MRVGPAVAALFALSVIGLSPHTALAGCNAEKVVDIAIAPGHVCWVYRGDATVFVGDFGGDQKISARMSGEMAEYDEASGRTVTHIGPRTPDVSGPGGFSGDGGDGRLDFYTPRAGVYRFSFTPCAMWGGNGVVEICAR